MHVARTPGRYPGERAPPGLNRVPGAPGAYPDPTPGASPRSSTARGFAPTPGAPPLAIVRRPYRPGWCTRMRPVGAPDDSPGRNPGQGETLGRRQPWAYGNGQGETPGAPGYMPGTRIELHARHPAVPG